MIKLIYKYTPELNHISVKYIYSFYYKLTLIFQIKKNNNNVNKYLNTVITFLNSEFE